MCTYRSRIIALGSCLKDQKIYQKNIEKNIKKISKKTLEKAWKKKMKNGDEKKRKKKVDNFDSLQYNLVRNIFVISVINMKTKHIF